MAVGGGERHLLLLHAENDATHIQKKNLGLFCDCLS